MFRRILVPFDGSDPSKRALEVALDMGEAERPVDLTVLKVSEAMNFDDGAFEVAARMAGVSDIDEEMIKAMRSNYVEQAKDRVREQIDNFFESIPDNINIHIVVKNGKPQEVICDYAEANSIDCIVMGRRGLGGIRAALGSVSTGVLRGTDLPVLVVK